MILNSLAFLSKVWKTEVTQEKEVPEMATFQRRTVTARAAGVSRKLREDGFRPVRADESARALGIRLVGDTFYGTVEVRIDFDGAHKRSRMTQLVRESLAGLGYQMSEAVETLWHSDEEIAEGHNFHGRVGFYVWLESWNVDSALVAA